MENTVNPPGSKVIILYKGDIIPAEVKNSATYIDSEGSRTIYTLVDPSGTDDRVLSWEGINFPEEKVFSTIENLVENIISEYKRKYVRETSG